MPSTSYNITMIKSAVENYSRQQILEVLNEISLIVFSDNTMRVEKIDTLTGMPPYLVTTNNIRNYNCPSDCRETAAIFCENPRNYLPQQERGLYTEYIWRGTQYYKVAAKQQSASYNQLAQVTFVDNPGDTTTTYFHQYFIKHTPLTSEGIQLVFPEEVHYLLRDGVIQMLKGENYSAGMGNIPPIEQIAHRIRSKLNKGTQARANRTPIRDVDRDDDFIGYY